MDGAVASAGRSEQAKIHRPHALWGFVGRVGAALVHPQLAFDHSEHRSNSGKSPSDVTALIALLFVAVNLETVITAGYLVFGGEIGGGLQTVATRLAYDLRRPLVVLVTGFVLVTLFAGRRRDLGADSDLVCVAFISLVGWAALLSLATVFFERVSVSMPSSIVTVATVVALAWYGWLLLLAVKTARRRPLESPESSSEDESQANRAEVSSFVMAGSAEQPIAGYQRVAGYGLHAIIGVVFVASLAAAASHWSLLRPRLSGDPAPNFSLPIIGADGRLEESVALAELRGKVVIIDFWATWCGPCRSSMPRIEAVSRKFADRDVVTLSINTESPRARKKARAMVDRLSPSAVLVHDTAGVADLFGVTTIPHLVVLDPEGTLVWVHHGGLGSSGQRDLTATIEKVLPPLH